MKIVPVKLGERSYNIYIGRDLISRLGYFIKHLGLSGAPLFIVTNRHLYGLHAGKLRRALSGVFPKINFALISDSERAKSLSTYTRLLNSISKIGRKIRPLVLAFGGGVTGDVSGFLAATYRRGVPFIQIPTTLLAQVDSAVGGKTAVDLDEAKNIAGCFYQPSLVLCDISILKTLPADEIRNGLAEVVKYGVIRSRPLFDYVSRNLKKILERDAISLERIVRSSVKIKSSIVEKDERDTGGKRIILNFGHTLGHAIESAAGYKRSYPHGAAVAVGMVIASEISQELGVADRQSVVKIKSLLARIGFSDKVKGLKMGRILNALAYDKKFSEGAVRFVLLKRLGSAIVSEDVTMGTVRKVLKRHLG